MNKHLFRTGIGICLCLFACISVRAAEADSLLKARIDTLLARKMPRGANAGVCIYDLTAGRTLYEYQADKLSRPASTMKLMTAITALAHPDAAKPFRTTLCTTGTLKGDTLKGDLYAVGAFDPEFDEDALQELVEGLTKRGIRVIDGRVVGDVSMKDSLYWGEGWLWDDAPAPYLPYMSPLMLNKGVVQLSIHPAEKGLSALVWGFPASSYYTLDNRTRSHTRSEGPLRVTRDWMHHSNRILLEGNVQRVEGRSLSVFDSGRFFLHVLTERLLKAGIRCTAMTDSTRREGIQAAYRFGELPAGTKVTELAAHETPVQAVLAEMLKESDNLNAEAMFYQLGMAAGARPATARHARSVVARLIEKIGLRPADYRVADGSGLSLYNYVTAELEVMLLRYAYQNTNIYTHLLPSLPVAADDGTLARRMRGTFAAGNVRAKTGSVAAVSSLAGFCTAANGHVLCFAIINQGLRRGSAGRAFQDRVCDELCRP